MARGPRHTVALALDGGRHPATVPMTVPTTVPATVQATEIGRAANVLKTSLRVLGARAPRCRTQGGAGTPGADVPGSGALLLSAVLPMRLPYRGRVA